MKNKILLKEIPSGRFHSALFTTYSINLYYLEQQVLPMLGSKNIHYISILVDSNMLSSQLDAYSLLSQKKKRNYSIHGIQSNGAFHPKIIFLAGQDSLLLLIGSGNLTSSGHGKNLEVWNAIYIDNPDDKKLGFLLQVWNYLKEIHSDLGESAQNKLKNVEENCILLSSSLKVNIAESYEIDKNTTIGFLSVNFDKSIFKQLSEFVGNEKIDRITIMSPYYDVEGHFIHELNKKYKPNEINIIIQGDFGAIPYKMKPKKNMNFFDWSDLQKEKARQVYFHAKIIVFESKRASYLVSGSANASMAAFGSQDRAGINHEACIVYRNKSIDFHDLLGINLKMKKVQLRDYEVSTFDLSNLTSRNYQSVFIKAAERNYDEITVKLTSKKNYTNARFCLFDSFGKTQFEKNISIAKGESILQLSIPYGLTLMSAGFLISSKKISNKQFIIDINAFESTNPSPRNRSLNQIRKLIESGNFSTSKIIDYLNTIYKQKEIKKVGISSGTVENQRKNVLIPEQESDLLYLSYAEIQEKAKHLNDLNKPNSYIEYKGVRLWESIFSYLKENREKEIQSKIDEEETEDINKSSGRAEGNKQKSKRPISKSNHQRLTEKVEKFLNNYRDILASKISEQSSDKPSLIDLSMFLIILEILLHLVSHKERIEGEDKEEHLLHIQFTKKNYSWSKYLIQFIGMFTLWCNKKGGFKYFDSKEHELKLSLYQKMAFKTSVSSLSIFNLINKSYDQNKISEWLKLSLLNITHSFNPDKIKYKDIEEFIEFVPQLEREVLGEGVLFDEISSNLRIATDHKQKKFYFTTGDIYFHPNDGYTFIAKIISNPSNIFYKLFYPGYEWDEEVEDYWNGKVYSIKEQKWFNSRKE